MSNTILVECDITDEELAALRARGIETRQTRDGLRLYATGRWQPKTVTGLLDTETKNFIGFILTKNGLHDYDRSPNLVFWTNEAERTQDEETRSHLALAR